MKKLLAILLALAVVLAGGMYWLTDSLHRTLEDGIAYYGSAMTKARVRVEHIDIEAGKDRSTIHKLSFGNPSGFKTAYALKADRVDIDIDMASMTRDVIVIRTMIIDGPDVIYENGESMTNFDAIQRNIASYLGPADRKGKTHPNIRLIVEELTICNARAQASAPFMAGKMISVPLADISLKNIGASKGGITPGELAREVAGALTAKLSVAARFDRLKKSADEASAGALASAGDLPR